MAKQDKEATADSKVATIRLINPDAKKGSVKYDVDPSESTPIMTGAYIMRSAAAKYLGIQKLEDAKVLEVSVRVVQE